MNKIKPNFLKLLLNSSKNIFGKNLNRSVGYESAISLTNLYPGSDLKLKTPQPEPNFRDKFTGYIPLNELDITYSKSSGPGGQNVNKVNTKVEIRFNVSSVTWLNENVKANLLEKLKNKMTKDGYAIFRSDLTRSQLLNTADCLEKIRTVVRSCCQEELPLSPETEEKIRRRNEKAARERLTIKRTRSLTKVHRQAPDMI